VAVGHLVLCDKLMLPLIWSFFPNRSGRDRKRVFEQKRYAWRATMPLFRRCLLTKPVFIVYPPNVIRSRALASFTNLRAHVT